MYICSMTTHFLSSLSVADKINLFNACGAWFAAIGTFSAVTLSLYLASRDRRIRLKISAGHRIVVTQGSSETEHPDFCSISVVNVGFRKATITGIGWKVGIFKKRYSIQTPSPSPYSSSMPVSIEDSEEAKWLIPFKAQGNYPNWVDSFAKEFIGKYPKIQARTIKLQIFTSTGKVFERRIEKGLQRRLIEAAQK